MIIKKLKPIKESLLKELIRHHFRPTDYDLEQFMIDYRYNLKQSN
jgi:hypothetical protein